MDKAIVFCILLGVLVSGHGAESVTREYRIGWDKVKSLPAGSYEVHRPETNNGDRDTLIYRGARLSLHLYQDQPPNLRARTCGLSGCTQFTKTQTKVTRITPGAKQDPDESKPKRLISKRRSRSAQKIARSGQPSGSRLVGLVEFNVDASVYGCDLSNPRLGLDYEFDLPGLKTKIVTNHRLLENEDGSWSWYAHNPQHKVTLNLNGTRCDSRPFGSVISAKGSFWIKPLLDSPLSAVYQLAF